MTLSKEQVENIAKLARIGLTEAEKEKFRKELSGIFEFINKLNEAKTENIEPIAQITGLNNIVREDKAKEPDEKQRQKLLGLAPEIKNEQVKVKAIL